MNTDTPQPLVGIIATALSVLLVVGILTFAGPCGVHDDGSVSSCFWAARAILGAGVVLVALSVARLLSRDEGERRGLSFGIALAGGLVAVLPGTLINLCMMQTMRCHTIMRPFALGVGAALAVVGGADLVVRLLKLRASK